MNGKLGDGAASNIDFDDEIRGGSSDSRERLCAGHPSDVGEDDALLRKRWCGRRLERTGGIPTGLVLNVLGCISNVA